MRWTGFFTLAALVLIAVPAWGQDPRVARPAPTVGPTGPTSLWVAISANTARMSGKIALLRRDPDGPSAQRGTIKTTKSNTFRAVALEGGGLATLDLEVGDEVRGQAQAPGDPIPDIDVSLAKLDGKAISEHRTTKTDAEGRFVFEHVPPGDYELRWEVEGQAQVQRVTIMTGAEGRVPGNAAMCGTPGAAARETGCPSERPACPAGESAVCRRGVWYCR